MQRMQFSIAKLLAVVVFINIVIAATWGLPAIVGMAVLLFISAVVLPPFLIVGAVNTRGIRQAFFLGAMVVGTPHFIYCTYIGVVLAIQSLDGESLLEMVDEDTTGNVIHLVGYVIGAIGGVCGMAAYWFVKFDESKPDSLTAPIESKAAIKDSEKENADETIQEFESRLPR